MKLYKYQKYSHQTLGSIIKNKIWLSGAKNFNDLFDCKFQQDKFTENEYIELKHINDFRKKQDIPYVDLGFSKFEFNEIIFNDVKTNAMYHGAQEYLYEFGIFCLSEIPDSILMWSHYADNHKGICLEFDVDLKLNNTLLAVNYATKYPKVSIYDMGINLAKTTHSILATKSADWSYEKEWRYIVNDKSDQLINNPFKLTSIIFGARSKSEDIETILEAVKHNKDVSFKKATQSNTDYEMLISDYVHI
ncbi:DUF2971 domain-containing protein [uncultured Tolumonas sp.]|uniref:DUF2971 domain-containing protein n=1 Tax=uncultured Tolumonas sp. TaxID=263765 RepID=UPI00292E50F4|nr:DUF2971 domain-containing protein [uncultured Tolumonas sp.]